MSGEALRVFIASMKFCICRYKMVDLARFRVKRDDIPMKQFLTAVLVVAFLAGCDNPKDNCLDETGAKISAFVISQRFVKEALLSPSTARFPYYTDDGVSVVFKRECHFGVIGYVDSQNGFGATVRSNYFIEIEANPRDGSYSGASLVIH